MSLLTAIMSAVVDTAFPFPPTDTDCCRPDDRPLFSTLPFLDVIVHAAGEDNDHA